MQSRRSSALFSPIFFILLSGLLVSSACSTAPDTAGPFTSEDLYELELDGETSDRLRVGDAVNPRDGAPYRAYRLDLERGEVIRVSIESGDLTPSLSLFAPDGTMIGSTAKTSAPRPGMTTSGYSEQSAGYGEYGGYDSYGGTGYGGYQDPYAQTYNNEQYDSFEGRSNLIRRASDTGSHLLIVSSRFSDEFGSFNLITETVQTEQDFSFPGDVTGYLFEGARLHPSTRAPRNRYPLSLAESTVVEVEMSSNDFQAHLSIVDARTEEVLMTYVETQNSRSGLLTELPAGEYEIWTSATQAGADGRYNLRAEVGEIDRSETFYLGETFRSFLGWQRDSIPSSMRSGESVTFEVEEAGILDAVMRSMDFNTYLILTDERGSIIKEDHDSGGYDYNQNQGYYDPYAYQAGVDARIHWPLEPGTYTLWTTSYQEDESGAYSLDAELLESPEATGISIDESTEGAITQASSLHTYRYTFVEYIDLEVEESQNVRISAESDDFDTFLILEDEQGQVITEEEYSYYGAATGQVDHHLNAGTYRIAVTTASPGQVGRFTVRAQTAPPSNQHGDSTLHHFEGGSLQGLAGPSMTDFNATE